MEAGEEVDDSDKTRTSSLTPGVSVLTQYTSLSVTVTHRSHVIKRN